MWRLVVAALAAISISIVCGACVGASGSGAVATPGAPGEVGAPAAAAEVPLEWRLCAADADCVRAPGDCCGCARGGRDVAVAVPFADAWSARIAERCAAPDACGGAERHVEACGGTLACRSGTCAIE